jgi:hypothetical protein
VSGVPFGKEDTGFEVSERGRRRRVYATAGNPVFPDSDGGGGGRGIFNR